MLPIHPVPMSQSQLNAASCSSIVVKTMARLHNQPLTPQSMTMSQPPKLPQRPILPVVTPTPSTSFTLVPAPQSASPMKPALYLLLKKRKYMSAETKHKVLETHQPQPTEQKSIDAYPNLNDVFGCVEHMLKEEEQSLKVIQPPLSHSSSLPSLEQLVLHRDHDMNVIFQCLVKQGHSEQFAIHIAQEMATKRYKPTIDAILQSQQYKQQQNNEQPGSADYYHGDNNMLFKSDMPTSKRPKLYFESINQVLPLEILRKILQKLDIKNLCMAREICKCWKAIIDGFQLVEEAAGKILDFALMLKLNKNFFFQS